ncbi:hypothetical protein DMC47_43405 [Nostoc sp. 3335mG]|nr:hypothetical protein DMC47_43405 [Nostoc sp. 3335mG]
MPLPPLRRAALIALAGVAVIGASAPQDFVQREGLNLNSFVRSGPVSAHIVLRSGTTPRLIVAFPAGNSGTGLWFDTLAAPAEWSMADPAQPVTMPDAKGRPLHGVTFTISTKAPRLVAKQAVLSSIRVLRDYQALGSAPAEVLTAPVVKSDTMTWSRDRLDGAPGYRLSVRITSGRIDGQAITAGADGTIRLAVTALTGEAPLTPLGGTDLLNGQANADPAARRALTFLSYREKFLAGSWRFDTYFGRDTLMSVRLLMPALQPAAVETGLRSVLERLSPTGEVAHEEDIGEFAILDHRKADGTSSDAPVYNYKMIDSDFLLAPVARAWLLDDPRGKARAAAFLGETDQGARLGALMMRNIRLVVAKAEPFANDPRASNLIALNPGMDAGEWRDSNDGLGGGRLPYDVNAILLPAALEAAGKLNESGLLKPYLQAGDAALLDRLSTIAAIWRDKAPALFDQSIPAGTAKQAVSTYAKQADVPADPALRAIAGPVRFRALSLDAKGKAIPIQNSDEGFALLFGRPSTAELTDTAALFTRPFPAGLRTGAGLLVANPVFASPSLQAKFSPSAYHGTVIWSWQQALAAAGLARQLERADLAPATRNALAIAQSCLWDGIDATREVQSSELWSWRYANGRYQVVAFGANRADVDESNAAQLWSTVYLALRRPATAPGTACPAA